MNVNGWIVFGMIGQLIFGSRFFIQWICSERRKESYFPIAFWYCSIIGGIILLSYALYRRDPVFIVGQCGGLIIYARNLRLIYKKKAIT